MVQKKKKSSKKKKNNKVIKQIIKFIVDYQNNLIGFFISLLSILGYFNLGLIGNIFANSIRLFFGNTYRLILIFTLLFGIYFLFNIKQKIFNKIHPRYYIGSFLMFIGWLIYSQVKFVELTNQHSDFFINTWNIVINQIRSNGIDNNVGGGLIGSIFLTIFSALISVVGTKIFSILIFIFGIIIFFNIPIIKIIKRCFILINEFIINFIKQLKDRYENKQERVKYTHEPIKKETKIKNNENIKVEDKKDLNEPSLDININTNNNKIKNQQSEEKEENYPNISVNTLNPDSDYKLPKSDLLVKKKEKDQSDDYKDIQNNSMILQKTLSSFGVDAEVKNVNLGPSVTEYELHPAIGVKVSKIVNLSDDLALALAAKDIRIEAPIPGKSLIGIEVPNKNVSTVSFREVFEASFQKNKTNVLEVPLGKDVNGDVISSDLTKMPHLLIAGSTGSGKSVAINGILTSILLKASPDQVKLMLIDPKKVELGSYNGIPHLLSPVVSEPKKAARALQKVVAEMEKRYELFAKTGQRKIGSYNEFVKKHNQDNEEQLPLLPYIVVIVDELADLMMTVSNDVESSIIRLAQMGRAAGVHMILATQRPSVDVITGLIKANVPSRIAFAVSSGIDSRTILDSNGAEKLLGRGDMLYQPIDKNKPVRIQGAFVPDDDVENVVDFVKDQQEVKYDDTMVVSDDEIKDDLDENNAEEDELFNDVLNIVVKEQKASTSMIQRHFRIGYNRAARIIDDLENRGYIGPQQGSKPREVYKKDNENKKDDF
ncbi:cell division protein FtsK [Lactobacillus sp. S2-2]|uniref:DNA translocase FtsK n=1 Tax=Lactobacillus sp. S2-2 TaxID=2692917 RepID=UPI001F32516A|nr:DNA translocase FtsK [Lactobacillus sp. S2-2]MCF6514846.1 cell division protein FtsK [Lactobacillus sp. S2-2]